MTGKEKCKILREIRKRIARANHISYPPEDCDYEGEDCPGTCPRCEMEVMYLQMVLKRKRENGEEVVIDRYVDNALRFQPFWTPDPNEDPRELPVLYKAHWTPSPDTFLALNAAEIVTVGDLLRFSSTDLIQKYGISPAEIDRMSEMLRRMGLTWGRRRRSRYENIRGMMRGPHG